MIQSFRHKNLQRLYEKADRKGLSADMVPKIDRIIARLDVATGPDMMNVPGLKLHRLKGELKGFWSVWVTGNWRIVFRFEGSHVFDVDLVDYH
ncbi:MAG: type II toxin-antitoxin system RelE/ParE family toxin [Gammaproteobacteria bacterium]